MNRNGGAVLECDRAGRIVRVIHDDIGLALWRGFQQPLPVLFKDADLPKVLSFIAAIKERSYQKDWSAYVGIEGSYYQINMSGYEESDRLVITLNTANDISSILGEFTNIINKQADEIRELKKDYSYAGKLESVLLEFSETNNQLCDLQRDLTIKNVELEKINFDLERKNKFIQGSAAIAAHDLRSPLNIIGGFAQCISASAKDRLTLAEKEYLTYVENAVSQMSDFIDSVLESSSIEAGEVVIHINDAEINHLVHTVIDLVQQSCVKRSMNLIYEDGCGSVKIAVDQQKIKRVMKNYLENAIKYSMDNSVILVETTCTNGIFSFSVTDHGLGISEGELEKLFKPFSKTSNRPLDGSRSTGLGLSICKSIVELHGGSVGVESKQGEGSTFYFTLPIRGMNDGISNTLHA